MRAIAEAVFDRGSPVPAARLDFIEQELLALLRAAGPRARALFIICLFGVVVLAPLWSRRVALLWSLPRPERIAALARMEESPLGAALVLAVKAPLCILYYEQPDAAAEIGYRPGCLQSSGLTPLQRGPR